MSRRLTRSNAAESLSVSHVSTGGSNQHSATTGMYMSSQYNHPAFNKLCLGSSSTKGYHGSSAVPKPPKAPEKPLMPYMRYSRKVWEEVKASQPDLKLWEIGKIIGKMWRELPAPEKQSIMDEYETEKIDYQEMLRAYHNSPAYQNYLQAKGRAEMNESMESQIEREDAYLSIEPGNEDAAEDDGLSVKHVSAARFQRNQRLMQEILADCNVVQSGRSVVTSKRLKTLCQQVESLEHHHGKLQNELVELEKKHVTTKRKWQEQTVVFEKEMKRLKSMTPEECYKECKAKAMKSETESSVTTASSTSDNNPVAQKKESADKQQDGSDNDKQDSDTVKKQDETTTTTTKSDDNVAPTEAPIQKKLSEESSQSVKKEAANAEKKSTTVVLEKTNTSTDSSNGPPKQQESSDKPESTAT